MMTRKTKLNFFPYEANGQQYPNLEEIPSNLPSDTIVKQPSVGDDAQFLSKIEILKKLGDGGSGVAYLVNFHFSQNNIKNCVIKIPVESSQFRISGKSITLSNRNFNSKAKYVFNQEIKSLVKLFSSFKTTRNEMFDQNTYALKTTNFQQIQIIQQELKKLKDHPGHPYLHEFLHVKPSCLLIISEPCLGDVDDLATKDPSQINAKFLLQFQLQTGLAMHYISHSFQLYHSDFKPANVFYNKNTQGSYHFKLSDLADLWPFYSDIYTLHETLMWPIALTPIYNLIWQTYPMQTDILAIIKKNTKINTKNIMFVTWILSFAKLYMAALNLPQSYGYVILDIKQHSSHFERISTLFPKIYQQIIALQTTTQAIYLTPNNMSYFENILNDLIQIYNQNTSPTTKLNWRPT